MPMSPIMEPRARPCAFQKGRLLESFRAGPRYRRNVRLCAVFWTPAAPSSPRAQRAGVQKAPRHEVAGSWAAAGRRALWRIDVGAEFDSGRDTGATRAACLQAGAGERVGKASRPAFGGCEWAPG